MKVVIQSDYSALFSGKRPGLDELLAGEINPYIFVLLSYLSYLSDDDRVKHWCAANLSLNGKQRRHLEKSQLFKRPSNMRLWAALFERKIDCTFLDDRTFNQCMNLAVRSLSLINELDLSGDNENHYFINGILSYYRDNPLSQYFRASRIFLAGGHLSLHISDFEVANKFELKDFIKVCHILNGSYMNVESKTWPLKSSDWVLDTQKMSIQTGIPHETLKEIFKKISTSADEFLNCRDGYESHSNFFAERPYFKLMDNRYIPVDMKAAQNLIFNSLFHRVKRTARDKQAFMRDYGRAFEQYVTSLAEFCCNAGNRFEYKFIPEFTYGKPEKRSSDCYIKFYEPSVRKNLVLVIEAKSARILDAVRQTNDDSESVAKSIIKLRVAPFEQQLKSLSDVLESRVCSELTEENIYYFVSVTSDNFPLVVGDWGVEARSEMPPNIKFAGAFAMGIEEFENFVRTISSDKGAPFGYLLEGYRNKYQGISIKDFLSFVTKSWGVTNKSFDDMIYNSQSLILDTRPAV